MRRGRILAGLSTFALFCVLCGAHSGAFRAAAQDAGEAVPEWKRIALLPAPQAVTDKRVQRALTDLQTRKEKKKAAKRTGKPGDHFSKLQEKPPPRSKALPPLTLIQLNVLAKVLFRETLAERMQSKTRAVVVAAPGAAGGKSETVVRIGTSALSQENRNGTTVVLRLTVQRIGAKDEEGNPLPDRTFAVSGAATEGTNLMGLRTTRPVAQLAAEAARQAAARAAHTLQTNESLPLAEPNATLLLAPLAAPTTADVLRFTASGRKLTPAGVTGLPADIAAEFAPDTLPLLHSALRPAYTGSRWLAKRGETAGNLWSGEDTPNVPRLQAMGRAVGAAFVLAAHLSDLEIEESPALPDDGTVVARDTASVPLLTEGRAEAVGVLVRVSDGAVLWSERANATVQDTFAAGTSDERRRRERKAANDAGKFALMDLQRRWHGYTMRFER